MNHNAARRERLSRHVHTQELDGFLVSKVVNVSYLTNFSGDSSYLLVGRDRVMLVTDGRYVEQCKQECPEIPLHVRPPAQNITKASAECINKLGWRKVGLEAAHVSIQEAGVLKELCPTVDFQPTTDVVEGLRVVKDDEELRQIKEAIGMAERAFALFRASLGPDDTEKSLGDLIEMLMRSEGARCGAFSPIVSVNERSALPHAPLSQRKLESAELLLVDWGASGRFYKSDLTRVLAPRKISTKLRQTYEVVLRAQARAIAAIRPGVLAQDVDAEARAEITDAGFGSFFSHSLGHGFGLEIHEAPQLRSGIELPLAAGMVCTVEPGIYLPDWGGVRIEDDVLVTPEGCEILTSVTRDLDSLTQDW